MRARLSFALTALTLLFTLQALSVLLSASFPMVYDAVFPQFRPVLLAGLLVPVAALLAPALPFSLWLDRRATLLGAAGLAAVLRVPLALPDPLVRLLIAALVVGAGGIFLGKAVGYLDRRSVAAGTAAAVLLEQLLRSAGWSWDVTLRAGWLLPQAILSAAALAIAWRWAHAPDDDEITGTLERRAGGLRLRGAVALGCLLFLETAVLARPAVGARLSGAPYPVVAVALAVAGAAAVLLIIARGPVPRGRGATAGAVAAVAVAVLVPRPVALPGWAAIVLLAIGHAGALLLLGRALVPAGGRRRGRTTATALSIVFLLNALLSATAFHAFIAPWLERRAPWLLGAAALLATVALILMPKPVPALARRTRPAGAIGVLVATAAATALLVYAPPVAPGDTSDRFVIASYNVHYGFDEAWRHDPEAIARAIAASGADLVALQEVTAGLPAAYNVDLALWLGRRLGMDALYAPSAGPLVGDAVLARVPRSGFTSTPLPADTDPKQIARVRIDALGGFDLIATHLGLGAEERAAQIAAVVAAAGTGPAVLAGDLNAQPGDPALDLLRAAGFRDAFELAGAVPQPTAPAARPMRRIDWIWLRGIDAHAAFVSDAMASDHRLVAAVIDTLR